MVVSTFGIVQVSKDQVGLLRFIYRGACLRHVLQLFSMQNYYKLFIYARILLKKVKVNNKILRKIEKSRFISIF